MARWTTYNRHQLMWELTKAGSDSAIEVKCGFKEEPWAYRMRLRSGAFIKGPALTKWDEMLFHALRSEGKTYIMLEENNFYLASLATQTLIVDFEIVGRMLPNKRVSKKKGLRTNWNNSGVYFYKFGELLCPDIPSLALHLFGEINPYTIGRAYTWNNLNQYTPVKVSGEHIPIRVADFTAAGMHYSSKGKPKGVAFFHRTVGFINGLEELKAHFPDATVDGVKQLHKQFGLKPSTHVKSIFERGATVTPEPPKPEVDYGPYESLVNTYKMVRSGPKYLTFQASYGEIVITSAKKLCEELRQHGETITYNKSRELWKMLMGGDEE